MRGVLSIAILCAALAPLAGAVAAGQEDFDSVNDLPEQRAALLALFEAVGRSSDVALANSSLQSLGYTGSSPWGARGVSYCWWWGVSCCGSTLTADLPVCQRGSGSGQSVSSIELPAVGLRGTLPDVFGDLQDLLLLDVSFNRGLQGTLPDSLGALPMLWRINAEGTAMRCNATTARPPPCPLPRWLRQLEGNFYYERTAFECPAIAFVRPREREELLARVYRGAPAAEVMLSDVYYGDAGCLSSVPGRPGAINDDDDQPASTLSQAVLVIVILVPSLAVSVGLVLLSVALMRYLRYLKRSHDAIHLTEAWKRRNPPGIISDGNDRVLREVTLVVTDVEGSTELWEWDYGVMTVAQEVHDSVMRSLIGRYCGYEVTTEGDSFTVAFHDAFDAVCWSLAMQQAMLEADWPPELLRHGKAAVVHSGPDDSSRPGQLLFRGLRVRVAISTGIPSMVYSHELTNTLTYAGPVMDVVAALSDLPAGGQVLLGPHTFGSIASRLAELGVRLVLTEGEAAGEQISGGGSDDGSGDGSGEGSGEGSGKGPGGRALGEGREDGGAGSEAGSEDEEATGGRPGRLPNGTDGNAALPRGGQQLQLAARVSSGGGGGWQAGGRSAPSRGTLGELPEAEQLGASGRQQQQQQLLIPWQQDGAGGSAPGRGRRQRRSSMGSLLGWLTGAAAGEAGAARGAASSTSGRASVSSRGHASSVGAPSSAFLLGAGSSAAVMTGGSRFLESGGRHSSAGHVRRGSLGSRGASLAAPPGAAPGGAAAAPAGGGTSAAAAAAAAAAAGAQDNEHMPMVIDLGSHWLDGLAAAAMSSPGSSSLALQGLRLTQIVTRRLAPRAAHFPPLPTPRQLYPSYFQAPSAAVALLPDGLVFRGGTLPVVTVAFCAPDGLRQLEASSRRAAKQALEMFCSAVRTTLGACGGYECQEKDGIFMLAFSRPAAALEWACVLNLALLCVHWAPEVLASPVGREVLGVGGELLFRGIRARVGIFKGEITRLIPHRATGRADYFGPPVNRAARFLAASAPGQILAERGLVDEVAASWSSREQQSLLAMKAAQGDPRASFTSSQGSVPRSSASARAGAIAAAAAAAVAAVDADAAGRGAQPPVGGNSPRHQGGGGRGAFGPSAPRISDPAVGSRGQVGGAGPGSPCGSPPRRAQLPPPPEQQLEQQQPGQWQQQQQQQPAIMSFSFGAAEQARQGSCELLLQQDPPSSPLPLPPPPPGLSSAEAAAAVAPSPGSSCDQLCEVQSFTRAPTLSSLLISGSTHSGGSGEMPQAAAGSGGGDGAAAAAEPGAQGACGAVVAPGPLPTLYEVEAQQQQQQQPQQQQQQPQQQQPQQQQPQEQQPQQKQQHQQQPHAGSDTSPPAASAPRLQQQQQQQQHVPPGATLAHELYAGFDDASSNSGLGDYEESAEPAAAGAGGRLRSFLQRHSGAGSSAPDRVGRVLSATSSPSSASGGGGGAAARRGSSFVRAPTGSSHGGQVAGPGAGSTAERSRQGDSASGSPPSGRGMLGLLQAAVGDRGHAHARHAPAATACSGAGGLASAHEHILYSGSGSSAAPPPYAGGLGTPRSAAAATATAAWLASGRAAPSPSPPAGSRRAAGSFSAQQPPVARQPRGPSFSGPRRGGAAAAALELHPPPVLPHHLQPPGDGSSLQHLQPHGGGRLSSVGGGGGPGGAAAAAAADSGGARSLLTMASDGSSGRRRDVAAGADATLPTPYLQHAAMPLLTSIASAEHPDQAEQRTPSGSSLFLSASVPVQPQAQPSLLAAQPLVLQRNSRSMPASSGAAPTTASTSAAGSGVRSVGSGAQPGLPQVVSAGGSSGQGGHMEALTGALPLDALPALRLNKLSKHQSFILQAIKDQVHRSSLPSRVPLHVQVHDQGTWAFKGISGAHNVALVLPSRLVGRLQHVPAKRSSKAVCVQPAQGVLHELWVEVVNLGTLLLDPDVLVALSGGQQGQQGGAPSPGGGFGGGGGLGAQHRSGSGREPGGGGGGAAASAVLAAAGPAGLGG